MKTLALAVLLLACAPAYAQMYKCVDQRGVTHYSDKPLPPSCKGGEVKIRATPPTGTAAERPGAAGTAAEISRRCARTAQEYTRMQSARRDGKPDESRDQRIEELREQGRVVRDAPAKRLLESARVAHRRSEENHAEKNFSERQGLGDAALGPGAGHAFGEVGEHQHARPLVGVAPAARIPGAARTSGSTFSAMNDPPDERARAIAPGEHRTISAISAQDAVSLTG